MKTVTDGLRKGIGGHQTAYKGATDEWLTPPAILQALGPFDLDPCAPVDRPWDMAAKHFTIDDNGLMKSWGGSSVRVWLNPPYGPNTGLWTAKLANHGNGIALIFARTETAAFHEHCWNRADAMLFLRGRLTFHRVDGSAGSYNGGAPSVLVAYGAANVGKLFLSGIKGKFVKL